MKLTPGQARFKFLESRSAERQLLCRLKQSGTAKYQSCRLSLITEKLWLGTKYLDVEHLTIQYPRTKTPDFIPWLLLDLFGESTHIRELPVQRTRKRLIKHFYHPLISPVSEPLISNTGSSENALYFH